jgi:hypothetical protein
MRRTFIILSLWMTVVVHAPAARAGDDGSISEENEQAERAIRRLRRQGVAAAPKIVRALRSDEGLLAEVAEDELVRWGPPAVPALLDALARHRPRPGQYSEGYETEHRTLSALLCHAGRPSRNTYALGDDETPDTPRVRARALPQISAALSPLLAALANKRSPRASAAADAIIDMAYSQTPCPNLPRVFATSGDRVVALLDVQPRAQVGDFLIRLGALGPAAKAAVPSAMRLMDDPRLQQNAIQLLGDIGPASAPAVAKLRALLAGKHGGGAAMALGDIGAPARAALPEIVALFVKADQGCDKNPSSNLLAEPVGALGATGETEATMAVQALLASWRACPRNKEVIVAALGAIGPRGRAAETALLAALRDGSRRLELRLAVAKSLHAIGAQLSASDKAVVAALEAEMQRRRTPTRSLGIGNQVGN